MFNYISFSICIYKTACSRFRKHAHVHCTTSADVQYVMQPDIGHSETYSISTELRFSLFSMSKKKCAVFSPTHLPDDYKPKKR